MRTTFVLLTGLVISLTASGGQVFVRAAADAGASERARVHERPNPYRLDADYRAMTGENRWNLITGNSRQLVSGIYCRTVEDRTGRVPVGKATIIL